MSHSAVALFTLIREVARRYPRAALASSLSVEDMVITDAIAATGFELDVFVIDTGRLHPETIDLIGRTEARYGIVIEVVRPIQAAAREYVRRHGADAFYESVPLRHQCCEIRKVEPLGRALAGRTAWLTGQRRAHGPERASLDIEETDVARDLAKFNPLAFWSDDEVWSYARDNNVPVNPLHARGYPSIGCAPCTRPIRPGEPMRAGRWWWETRGSKECGLHLPGIVAAATVEAERA